MDVGYFVPDVHQFLFGFLEYEESEQYCVGVVGFDELDSDVEAPRGLSVLFQNQSLQVGLKVILVLAHLRGISPGVRPSVAGRAVGCDSGGLVCRFFLQKRGALSACGGLQLRR